MTDINRLVEAYISCRDSLNEKRKAFKEIEKNHKADLKTIEDAILKICQEQKVESFKTEYGTAFKKKRDFIKVENWDMALDFMLDNDLRHLLTKSVAKAAAKEYMEENDNQLPPGLDYGFITEIGIRRK